MIILIFSKSLFPNHQLNPMNKIVKFYVSDEKGTRIIPVAGNNKAVIFRRWVRVALRLGKSYQEAIKIAVVCVRLGL